MTKDLNKAPGQFGVRAFGDGKRYEAFDRTSGECASFGMTLRDAVKTAVSKSADTISRAALNGEDPRRLHVTCLYDGRSLIGEVTGFRDVPNAGRVLTVKHFNGETWPLDPFTRAVSVLSRV